MKEFYEVRSDILTHGKINNKFNEFEKFLIENEKLLDKYELGNGYLKLIYHYAILNDYKKSKELSEKMFFQLENENLYSMLLENLNILFCFFGHSDSNIINYLMERYENLILKHSNLNKDDFEELVKLTLNEDLNK